MTSQINSTAINDQYPVAGQPNNTQGFRDNFAATKTNFAAAASEITELQTKSILNATLTGGSSLSVQNNMLGAPLIGAKIRNFSADTVEIATTSGPITLDYTQGSYQRISTTGNISVGFINWPADGSYGDLRVQTIVDTPGRTMTISAPTLLGTDGVQGYANGTITFAKAGTYQFEFSSSSGGNTVTMFDLNRPLANFDDDVQIDATTVSTSTTTGALTVAGGIGAQGNIYGGNLRTPGALQADGNIQGLYVLGDGGYLSNVTVVSNVAVTQVANGTSVMAVNGSGGNITLTVGGAANRFVVSNVSTAITSNVTITGNLSVTGNVLNNLSVSRTVDAGNLITSGTILAAGNITGAYLLGNGSQLDGIYPNYIFNGNSYIGIGNSSGNANISIGSTSNVVVVSTTGVRVAGIVSATGNITGGNISTGILSLGTGILGNTLTTGFIKTSSGYGIGYTTGAGGTVTQSSNKSTGITLDRICGEITTSNQNLAGGANVTFTMTNTTVEPTDVMVINHVSGGTLAAYQFYPVCGSGSANITIVNRTGGALAEALVLRYVVIKGSVS